ncbi:MAG: MotA/TolQ/ExbB proton channel family protein, partial [Nevskiales bacterium]|nr:MotA/TolQ/ExbB proton channel family protein [Nevskiales bacterium]
MTRLILALMDISERIRAFVDSGGWVLLLIAGVIFLMWALIIERWVFFRFVLGQQEAQAQAIWAQRAEHHSWCAHQVRRALIANVYLSAQQYLPMIKTLVAVCPLFGLMGTVTGMISVFDVMATSGMGNPRLMASGVSSATIPTMAGMVGALSGLFAIHALERTAA